MLIDIEADKLNEIYMCCGYVDLRMGINGLSALVEYTYNVNPYRENVLFLFCGKTSSWKIKGLIWENLSAHFCYPHIFLKSPDYQ